MLPGRAMGRPVSTSGLAMEASGGGTGAGAEMVIWVCEVGVDLVMVMGAGLSGAVGGTVISAGGDSASAAGTVMVVVTAG